MSALLQDDAEADDEFWGQAALAEVRARAQRLPPLWRWLAMSRWRLLHQSNIWRGLLAPGVQEEVDDAYKSEAEEEDKFDSDFNDSEVLMVAHDCNSRAGAQPAAEHSLLARCRTMMTRRRGMGKPGSGACLETCSLQKWQTRCTPTGTAHILGARMTPD